MKKCVVFLWCSNIIGHWFELLGHMTWKLHGEGTIFCSNNVWALKKCLDPCREPVGAAGRFTITPLRHYPLQQPGVSSVGVLPPVQWDGFRKKNILSPRNSPAVLSPVTVKIARPVHHHSSPRSPQSHLQHYARVCYPVLECTQFLDIEAKKGSEKWTYPPSFSASKCLKKCLSKSNF